VLILKKKVLEKIDISQEKHNIKVNLPAKQTKAKQPTQQFSKGNV
jgi:hypothetical protein